MAIFAILWVGLVFGYGTKQAIDDSHESSQVVYHVGVNRETGVTENSCQDPLVTFQYERGK